MHKCPVPSCKTVQSSVLSYKHCWSRTLTSRAYSLVVSYRILWCIFGSGQPPTRLSQPHNLMFQCRTYTSDDNIILVGWNRSLTPVPQAFSGIHVNNWGCIQKTRNTARVTYRTLSSIQRLGEGSKGRYHLNLFWTCRHNNGSASVVMTAFPHDNNSVSIVMTMVSICCTSVSMHGYMADEREKRCLCGVKARDESEFFFQFPVQQTWTYIHT